MRHHIIYRDEESSELIKALVAENPTTKASKEVRCEACDRLHESDDEPIFHSEFDGKNIVLDCECNYLGGIEEFLNDNRDFIEEYYRRSDAINRKRILRVVSRRSQLHVV